VLPEIGDFPVGSRPPCRAHNFVSKMNLSRFRSSVVSDLERNTLGRTTETLLSIKDGDIEFLEVELAVGSSLESWVRRSVKAVAEVCLPLVKVVASNGTSKSVVVSVNIVWVAMIASPGDEKVIFVSPGVCDVLNKKIDKGEKRHKLVAVDIDLLK
jgi:hypothetical protein